jgi:putative ATPase
MAIEDIGLADPRGAQLALDAWQTYERLGSPEGELAVANALVFLAVAPKSNAAYVAFNEARADVEQFGTLDVPLRFRNAPTRLMKELGYHKGYTYAHDSPDAYIPQQYLPDELRDATLYTPGAFGYERKIAERLEWWRRRAAEEGDG